MNVLDAQSDRKSLLNWIEQLLSIRKQCPEIGTGKFEIVGNKNADILIHRYASKHGDLYFIHNFSSKKIQITKANLPDSPKEWVHIFGVKSPKEKSEKIIEIEGFGFHWWRLLV